MTPLADRFEEHRGHLRAVAYRMLGSLSDAEDAVQETWLRLDRTDVAQVTNLTGWLTTVVSRICLDMLRSRGSRREEPLEQRLSEAAWGARDGADPEREAVLADSVGRALLVVLDRLAPAERIALVLHDMFAVPFEEIAPILDRSQVATKKLASRARQRVRGSAAVSSADLARHRQVVEAFLPPSGPVTWRGCSRFSTQTSYGAPTPPRYGQGCRRGPRGRGTWRRSRCSSRAGPASPNRPWSTERSASSWRRAAGCWSFSRSPSRTGRSPRTT
ncbi:sigma-70 family RNA polymerase sigma factor [Actinopolymorpha pittospori]|uniref:RNA polymerase sigma factor (Sigma-70 family) n=1 Tax=Actinopolymorpha pittospori TaxID=648752 RepID=A0A927N128_9ACTN|nr:RNA polymerase sigma factor (sigma-70 family) [Actinopolymorpha pittospori]